MAAAIQTLTLDVHYTITRDIIAPTQRSPSGGGGVMFRRLYERPLYQFTLRAVHEHRASAQALYGFAHYHQGDIAFWYSGDIWANPHNTTAALIGFGDGARTHFFLPNRHILSGPTIKVNGSPATHTLTASSGLIVLDSAAADGHAVTAEAYTCKYKCVFWNSGDVLQSEDQFYASLSRFEGIVLREVLP